MIVRAYFLLDDPAGGDPALVPVLRTVAESPAAATAAMTQLLAGPSAKERSATPRLTTLVPAGTKLLGIDITGGLATVDLSGEFAIGGDTHTLRASLAQVTYTLTQFSTVDRVVFELNGVPNILFWSEGVILDEPVTRATFRDEFLPPIFVDRPAWGASLLNPGRVAGLANVYEAQFQIALLDHDGKLLAEATVRATCGTGCWGRFDVNLPYDVSTAQWGTLRVWDISEGNGEALAVREYPVYLKPAP